MILAFGQHLACIAIPNSVLHNTPGSFTICTQHIGLPVHHKQRGQVMKPLQPNFGIGHLELPQDHGAVLDFVHAFQDIKLVG